MDFALDMMAVGGLAVMGLIAVLFFLIQRRDRASFWLGLFCLGVASHFLFGQQHALARQVIAAMGIEAGALLEAAGWYLSLASLVLLVDALYPGESSPRIVRGTVIVCLVATATAIVLPATWHAHAVIPMQIVTLATSAWLVFVLARVSWRRQAIWTALLAGMPLLYPGVVFDLFHASTVLRYALAPLGLVAFIVAPVAVLAKRLAGAMSRQEKRTDDLLDSVPVALSIRDTAGRYLFVNRAWEKWFGSARGEIVGARVGDRFSQEIAQRSEAADRAALERGPGAAPEMTDFEYQGRRYTQTRTVMTDELGKVTGVLVASLDTTERHAQELKLLDQMALTRALIDENPNPMYLKDTAGRYVTVNDAFLAMTGTTREQAVGRLVHEVFPDDGARKLHEDDLRLLAQGTGWSEAEAVRKGTDGKPRWIIIRKAVLRRADGEVIGLIGTNTNITRLKRYEAELLDQMALTRALIDENPNAMYLKDRDARYVTVNAAWERMVGVPRERALGKNVVEIFGDEESKKYLAVDMELLAHGEGASEVESLRTGPDGKPQWLIVRKTILRGGDGQVIGLVGVNTDITRLKHYEIELAERGKFISQVIETLPASVAIRDTTGRYLQVNRTWEQFFNIRREDLVGRRLDELPQWQGNQDLLRIAHEEHQIDEQTLAAGNRSIEATQRTRMGRVYLNTRRALVDTAGQPVGIVSVSIDVTEQRTMEEALEMEQRRLALVVRASKAGIVDWDGVTHQTYYSPRFREILGHAPDADTSNWPDYFKVLLHPDDRERFTSRWQAFIRGKGPDGPRAESFGPDEHRLLRKDGSYVWVEVSGIAVRNEKGFVTRWIAATTDISERRGHEEQLLEHERQLAHQKHILETTLENIDQGITMVDQDLRAMTFNRRFLELLDFPEQLFHAGQFTLEQAFRYNAMRGEYGPGDVEEQVRTRVELAKKFEAHAFERKRPNGQVLAIRGKPLPGNSGFVTTYTDVTEQKRAEEQLKQSMALREEVERMSRHDLKTPINSVIAVSRLLRENKRLAPEDAELLATVERAGYRILNMVNLHLDLFRMEQGIYEFHPEPVDLDEVASKVATDLQGQAASKNVHVTVTRKRRAVARAEELLCYSIFANLVKNAIEAAPEHTSVTIELDREDDRSVVRIHNVGVVPEDIRSRFFQKYATAGKSAGLGLGAYSAHLLARVQGGKLTLNSSEREGTTLTVRLQAAEPDELQAKRDAMPKPVAYDAVPQLPSLRVLVADDDEFNRLVLRRYLPSPPLKVSLAVNGRAALDAAMAEWPDVVLLDLEMPVMDGYETAKKLRAIERKERRKRILIVAISSNDEDAIVKRALKAGCDHYLVKPASRETLWQMLAGAAVPLASGGVTSGEVDANDDVILDADLEAALPGFLASRREAIEEMPRVLEAGDREAFRRLAHRLAGSFALYGFKWASVQARGLERDAADGDPFDLLARVAALREHLQGVKIRIAPKSPVTP